MSIEKKHGRFYSPAFIVDNILDLAGYHGQTILKKHVIDNSCGDGAFLVAAVSRYCKEFSENDDNLITLSNELKEYVHGIDIDVQACKECIDNLNKVVRKYGIENVDWDICHADALSVEKYNGKMDFVLGNPPYVRVHNINDIGNVKNFSFAQNGMTDLYIVFYEIGLKMLNEIGVLGYITPSSFFNSVAGKYMREYFIKNNLIDKIVDLKHFQAFSATTYTTIAVLKKNRDVNTTDYYRFADSTHLPYYVDTLNAEDFYFRGNFYFAEKRDSEFLKGILSFRSVSERFSVKNGFATLADDVFIRDFDFDEFTIPVVKASTGKSYKCFFPYTTTGKLISYGELTRYPQIERFIDENRERLCNRSLEQQEAWYGFGRTQGINDVYKRKFAVNALVRTERDVKITKCDSGVGVFGGLYIVSEVSETELREMLCCDDFIRYISLIGKYKSGGYYTFSSKDLKSYLEYKYAQRRNFENGQLSFFEYN